MALVPGLSLKEPFAEGAVIPLTDRGFRYGPSVFETLAVRHGKILFLEQHWQPSMQLARTLDSEPRRSKLSLRWKASPTVCFVSMSQPGRNPSASAFDCRTFALFEPAEFPQPEEVGEVRIGISQEPSFAVIGGWKTGNYWPRVKALARAKNGLDEVLMQNSEGAVLSASMANVFFVFGSRADAASSPRRALRGSQGMGHGNDAG